MPSVPEEKIRVLIVDDIPETRENLRKLLYFEKDIEVVGVGVNGEQAVALAKDLQPHIILMDINMPGMDGIAASEAISSFLPSAQIVMMSVQGETDYLRRSMLAGAKGFLIKPFSSDEMITTIRRVYGLRPKTAPAPQVEFGSMPAATAPGKPKRDGRGQVFALFSPKGGAGRSLLATNLAIALRGATEKRVILVDCSLQFGDVGVLLNLTSAHTMAELADKKGKMDSELLDVLLTPHISGIKTLLAPPRPEQAELLSSDHVRELLTVLQRMFDYVVVDMASALNDLSLTIFDIADKILLVTTPDIPAIKSTRLFLEVTSALGYPADKTKLIVNKANDRVAGIGPAEIAASIRQPVLVSIAADERSAYMAVNQGIPSIMNNRTSPIAQGAIKLAQLLSLEFETPPEITKASPIEPKKESASILGRLLRK
jgi:pilus assembly protein CpaE